MPHRKLNQSRVPVFALPTGYQNPPSNGIPAGPTPSLRGICGCGYSGSQRLLFLHAEHPSHHDTVSTRPA
jgi:hypothetical protein